MPKKDMWNMEPVTLQGHLVRLEPLRSEHSKELVKIGLNPELWRWTLSQVANSEDMDHYVETALDEQRRGLSLPFAIVDQTTHEVIGSTRFANIEPTHRRLEIGWSWLTSKCQRTGANTEAKLLLLSHAFDSLHAHRVELKTDVFNEKSRKAILRIGAVQEGILRQHMVTDSGRVRDTVYFSIIDSEWPGVKNRLTTFLAKKDNM
jgi:RimJ/RimL family protein N-acetyltransferase